jgi:hypothetical protein
MRVGLVPCISPVMALLVRPKSRMATFHLVAGTCSQKAFGEVLPIAEVRLPSAELTPLEPQRTLFGRISIWTAVERYRYVRLMLICSPHRPRRGTAHDREYPRRHAWF